MRRVDRVRSEKRRRAVLTIGLAFALGALTAAGLIWRVDQLAATGIVEQVQGAAAEHAQRETPADTAAPAVPAATAGRTERAAVIPQSLSRRHLQLPVDGIKREQLHDTFDEGRAAGLRRHEALDIMAPRGTPVRAVEDGHIAKLFTSVAGGLTVYQFDPSQGFAYYYAHLDRYAPGLQEDQQVHQGDLLGYVGSTGNASENAPHLHFAIFQLGPERQWWKGDPINPYPLFR
jgi:murein DD-endopeptidase MepM/ murein hydrolase activator NlpD